MALITKANISADAVADEKIRLDNNEYLRGRNFADNGDINLLKVNASNLPEFGALPIYAGSNLATEGYVDASGGGIFKSRLHDGYSTTQTTGAPVIIDNVTIVNDDLVLFTALSSGNNKVYKATVVTGNVTAWTAQSIFSGSDTPVDGDMVYIQEGNFYANNILLFTGTTYESLLNQKVSLTLNDNSTNVDFIQFEVADFKFFTMEYSVNRGANGVRQGIFSVCSDGSTVDYGDLALSEIGADGVTFTAALVGTVVNIYYTTTSTGLNATLKRTAKVW